MRRGALTEIFAAQNPLADVKGLGKAEKGIETDGK